MKRIGALLVAVALIAQMVNCTVPPPAMPIPISDWYGLDAMRDNLGDSYMLASDLDCTTPGYEELAGPTANGGKGWLPIGTGIDELGFVGPLNGQGHEIRDLFIDRPAETYVGLFGVLWGGEIKDVGLVNATVTGNECVGGLVGENEGQVRDCHFTGNVTGEGLYVGGLVGYSFFGVVSNSHSRGNVIGYERVGGLVGWNYEGSVYGSYSACSVSGHKYVGGLLGYNHLGDVSCCYATGSVTGHGVVGGLVGDHYQPVGTGGGVRKCYSAGSVVANSFAGGLIGANFYDGWVTDSFWDTEISGQSASDGGTGKTTAQMKNIITFSGATWDVVAVANPSTRNPGYIWNIVDDQTYPFLSWQAI